MASLSKLGYDLVRIYDTGCYGPTMLRSALASYPNMKMFLGIADISSVEAEAADMYSQLGNSWDQVHTVSIGNEIGNAALLANQDVAAAVGSVIAALGTGRSKLRNLGFNGPVVAVDSQNIVEDYPQLCTSSDYCTANAHPYFGPGNQPEDAGAWVDNQVNIIKQKTGMDNHGRLALSD